MDGKMDMEAVKLIKEYDEYRISAHFTLGHREYYEDEYVIHRNKKNLTFFGIFDGHGGREAAQYVKDNLFKNILFNLNPENHNIENYTNDDNSFMKAIKKGFADTQEAMWSVIETWPKANRGFPSTSGTTASISILRCDRIDDKNYYKVYVGHVGDTKIILTKEDPTTKLWTGIELTKDHVPKEASENERIIAMGGAVNPNGRIVWNRPKVNQGSTKENCEVPIDQTEPIPFLSVSRALGDLWSWSSRLNDFIVSPIPDVLVTELDFNIHKSLILGTDGLWNVVTVNEATQHLKITSNLHFLNKMRPELKLTDEEVIPAYRLVCEAQKNIRLKRIRADNITAVVIEFKFAELEENQVDIEDEDTQSIPRTPPSLHKLECEVTIPRPIKKPTRISPMHECPYKVVPHEFEEPDDGESDFIEIRKSPRKEQVVDLVEPFSPPKVSPNYIKPATLILPNSNKKDNECNSLNFNGIWDINERKNRTGRRSSSSQSPTKSNDSESDRTSNGSPKRGRGRPKKCSYVNESPSVNFDESDFEESENDLHIVTDEEMLSPDSPMNKKVKKGGQASKIILTREDAEEMDLFPESHYEETFTSPVKKRGRPPKSTQMLFYKKFDLITGKKLTKKRGRPSKSKEPNQPETKVKKRGRPFKNKELGHETIGYESEGGKATGKKRGRPKKTATNDSVRFHSEGESVHLNVSINGKKRGRPSLKDKLASVSASFDDSSEGESTSLIVKKKRGRPSTKDKTSELLKLPRDEMEIPIVAKKKRGRKPKQSLELEASEGADELSEEESQGMFPIKKKRGRPPKSRLMAKSETGEISEGEIGETVDVSPSANVSNVPIKKKRGRPSLKNTIPKEEDGDITDTISEGEEGAKKAINVEGNVSDFEFAAEGNELDGSERSEGETQIGIATKKKRGRPLKNRDIEKNEEYFNEEFKKEEVSGQLEHLSAKRQRKTPSKYLEYSLTDSLSMNSDTPTIRDSVNGQKKRGRPFKNKDIASASDGTPSTSTGQLEEGQEITKKKRGRPSKSISISNKTDDEGENEKTVEAIMDVEDVTEQEEETQVIPQMNGTNEMEEDSNIMKITD